jgi:hypothetical protein
MATLLYNHLKPNFTHSAYITLGLDEGSSNAAMRLESILKQLGKTDVSSSTPAQALTEQLRQCVKGRQVLLVLDNVSSSQHLEDLLPLAEKEQQGDVKAGSVFIITSRQNSMPEFSQWKQVGG